MQQGGQTSPRFCLSAEHHGGRLGLVSGLRGHRRTPNTPRGGQVATTCLDHSGGTAPDSHRLPMNAHPSWPLTQRRDERAKASLNWGRCYPLTFGCQGKSLGRWDVGALGRWGPGSLGRWGRGTLGPWVVGALGRWGPGALGPWGPGALGPWDIGALGRWGRGTLGPWVVGAVGHWGRGTLGRRGPWDIGALGRWGRGTLGPWDIGAPGARGSAFDSHHLQATVNRRLYSYPGLGGAPPIFDKEFAVGDGCKSLSQSRYYRIVRSTQYNGQNNSES